MKAHTRASDAPANRITNARWTVKGTLAAPTGPSGPLQGAADDGFDEHDLSHG